MQKMRYFTLAAALSSLLLLHQSRAQTHIQGIQTGTLGPGAYIVDGNIEVPSGCQLTVTPGTEFLHTGYFRWTIRGEIIAAGTEQSPIRFDRLSPIEDHKWGSIHFLEGSSTQSLLQYCVLDYSKNIEGISSYRDGGAIHLEGVGITIRNCTISNSYTSGEGGGIFARGAENMLIEGCRIINCRSDVNGGGIFIGWTVTCQVKECVIAYNSAALAGGGFYCLWTNVEIDHCLVQSNTFSTEGGGLYSNSCSPQITNNTIVMNLAAGAGSYGGGLYAYLSSGFIGGNNIVYYNNAQTGPDIYGSIVNLNYNCISTFLAGIGNITSPPMFADTANFDFNLLSGSPCIDSGDPLSPPDPDSSRADMGAFYFDHHRLFITLTPANPPIIISSNGGSFTYDVELLNNTPRNILCDVWNYVRMPNGQLYRLGLRENIVLTAWSGITRTLHQDVPGTAPPGEYNLIASAGDFGVNAAASDSFIISKLWEIDNSDIISGWDKERLCEKSECGDIKDIRDIILSPNPFNAVVTISMILNTAKEVELLVYDIGGKVIATRRLGYCSGSHTFSFDGRELSSGIYFIRITAGNSFKVSKAILLK